MSGFIFRCSRLWYKCTNQVQTLHSLSRHQSSVKSKCLTGEALNITSILSRIVNQPHFVLYRTLYYLENENFKEYKRHPSVLDVTEDAIKEVCYSENPASPNEWDDVKMEIMTRCLCLTEEKFDSVLMQVLLQDGQLELAHSFMGYLRKRRLKPNFVTLCKYMVLCSKNMDHVEQSVILETYEKIISLVDTSILNSRMVEFLVQGLCATDKWQKSLDYINQLSKKEVTAETSNALASAALRNKNYDLAWQIMTQWYKSGMSPTTAVFVEYMKFVISVHQKDPIQAYICFTNLAGYARNRNIILKEKAVVYVKEYFERMHECKTSYSKVDRNGICCSCKRKIEPCSLTDKEFLYLRNSFFQHALQRSDIFINTTTGEFQKYCRLVDRYKPFDIVLDGLNVAHANLEQKNRKNLAMQLFYVVDHLSKHFSRILVLGRYHMMKEWPAPIMGAIRKKSIMFCVSNISEDDPFLIYGALASGPKALLVSDDMMRDHMSRLPDPKVLHLFKKWQQSHQVYLNRGENEGDIVLMGPLKHDISIQGNMAKGWHIPFDNEMKLEPYEELNNWLCVQKYI